MMKEIIKNRVVLSIELVLSGINFLMPKKGITHVDASNIEKTHFFKCVFSIGRPQSN